MGIRGEGRNNRRAIRALDEVAWYAANSEDETHPVGTKKPNAWGLYDMLGNVREWVEDLFTRDFYNNSPLADPTGPQAQVVGPRGGRQRGNFGKGGPARQLPIMRGGAWDNPAGIPARLGAVPLLWSYLESQRYWVSRRPRPNVIPGWRS